MESSHVLPIDTSYAPWSTAPHCVVDGVVGVLIRTRRWSRDGRSLRQLNKHWCQRMHLHIVSIHPHRNRILSVQDVHSLLKFPMLASVDITHFCDHSQPSISSDRCACLLDVLSRLKHLKDLTINNHILSEMTDDDFERLMVKTVTVNGRVSDTNIRKLNGSNLEEIKTNSLHSTFEDLTRLPSLQKIDIDPGYVTVDALKGLETMKEIRVHYWNGKHNELLTLTSIVSLEIIAPLLHGIEPLLELPRLKKLEFKIMDESIFSDAFWILMRQLTSLTLMPRKPNWNGLPEKFWSAATSLFSLELWCSQIDASIFNNFHFHNLRSLSLLGCHTDGGCIMANSLNRLAELEITYHHYQQDSFQIDMDLPSLTSLRRLKFQTEPRGPSLDDLLQSVCQLTKLEDLLIGGLSVQDSKDVFPYTRFEALGRLTNLSKLAIWGQLHAEVFNRITGMQFLTCLEELDMRVSVFMDSHEEETRGNLEQLVKAAPHLKL